MLLDEIMVPETNYEIYDLLYKIEVGLREFMIETLEVEAGSKWWKQRLPSDVKDTSKRGLQSERGAKWSEIVPHHPIYYTDFPDLKKIIIRNDNWRDIFQPIFEREDILAATLSELEPIRNKIAHNRKATKADLAIVRAAYKKIVTPIGEEEFLKFVARCTSARDILGNIARLQVEASEAFTECREYNVLPELRYWERIRRSWWFDSEYLDHEIGDIKVFFKTLFEYGRLPRLRGQGHIIEKWVKSQDLEKKYADAMSEFNEILGGAGDF